MHDHAEYGVAAHWRYKESGDKNADNNAVFADKVAWLRQVLDWREELTNRSEITEVFKNEIFSDTIYVMTPVGKIIALPKGSTPIDFAYHIHSNIGNRCRGAKVDGQIVPLSTPLQNGQHVEILTVKEGSPSVNWLYDGFVKSSKAIAHIRRYIRDQNNEEFFTTGIEIFQRELHKFTANSRPNNDEIIAKLGYANEKDLCIDLGNGELNPQKIRDTISEMIARDSASYEDNSSDKNIEIPLQNNLHHAHKPERGILVNGISGIATQIAKCCKPIPGDNIMGFISSGKGVVVHRSNCTELKRLAKLYPDKVMEVSFGNEADNIMFHADIEIAANDRDNLLSDLITLFATERISIAGLKSHTKNNKVFMIITLSIPGRNFDFSTLASKILAIHGINDVIRK
jgi:GTP pyrophosphokinase